MNEWTPAQRYEAMIDRIRAMVDRTNRDLGIDLGDWSTPKITFGYIGNCSATPGGYDDRRWSIFLPHPGRVGTDDDRLGSFPTGDLAGAQAALNALVGFRRGVRFATGPEVAEIHSRKAHQMTV